jgi:hypothetical protein
LLRLFGIASFTPVSYVKNWLTLWVQLVTGCGRRVLSRSFHGAQACGARRQRFVLVASLAARFQNQLLRQRRCLSLPNKPDKRVEILGQDLTAAYRWSGSNSCSEGLAASNDLRTQGLRARLDSQMPRGCEWWPTADQS